MKVLIIEDDINKSSAIAEFLNRYTDAYYVIKSSYHSGMREILDNKYDFLLLDMSMPMYDVTEQAAGGRSLPLAGRDILFQLRRRNITLKTIIVTQYEEFDGLSLTDLNQDLVTEFPDNYKGYVYYNTTQDTWKETLDGMIRNYFL